MSIRDALLAAKAAFEDEMGYSPPGVKLSEYDFGLLVVEMRQAIQVHGTPQYIILDGMRVEPTTRTRARE